MANNIVVTWNKVPDIDLLGYNIFANNYWVGTVDENDTQYIIKGTEYPIVKAPSISITIEAFDYDGETSPKRARVEFIKKYLNER